MISVQSDELKQVKKIAVTVTQSAVRKMWELSQRCSTETGGALIGAVHEPLIVAAGDPGPRSIKTAASFTTDPEADKAILKLARTSSGRNLQILGYWHKHPDGMNHPSGGDLFQARELLKGFQAVGESNPSLFCFILQANRPPEDAIFTYLLLSPVGEFQEIEWQAIDDQDTRVESALKKEPVFLETNPAGNPWQDSNFRFQNTSLGVQRLKFEKESLEQQGFRVSLRERNEDKRAFLVIEKESSRYLCVFPVEFPFGVPRIYQLPGQIERFPQQIGIYWNSDMNVAEWLKMINLPLVNQDATEKPPEIFRPEPHHSKSSLSSDLWWGVPVVLVGGALGLTMAFLWQRSHKIHAVQDI